MIVFLRSHVDCPDKLIGNAQNYQIESRQTMENVTTRINKADLARLFAFALAARVRLRRVKRVSRNGKLKVWKNIHRIDQMTGSKF
jgi:hypothetical protein